MIFVEVLVHYKDRTASSREMEYDEHAKLSKVENIFVEAKIFRIQSSYRGGERYNHLPPHKIIFAFRRTSGRIRTEDQEILKTTGRISLAFVENRVVLHQCSLRIFQPPFFSFILEY